MRCLTHWDFMNDDEAVVVLEAALLCAEAPMSLAELRKLFGAPLVESAQVRAWLEHLQVRWEGRGLVLTELASGWRFQSTPAMQPFLERLNPERSPRYSRAVMETLAIIAWRQPVTRGDIEDIRGVTVSTQIIRVLEERGWIEVVGHREAPGRPALLATTRQFLDDLGLRALDELPDLRALDDAELAAIGQGLLDAAPEAAGSVEMAEAGQQDDVPSQAVGASEAGDPGLPAGINSAHQAEADGMSRAQAAGQLPLQHEMEMHEAPEATGVAEADGAAAAADAAGADNKQDN